jgi:CIC family chloride channel protein
MVIMSDPNFPKADGPLGIPLAPSLEPTLRSAHVHPSAQSRERVIDRRVVIITALSMLLAVVAAGVAWLLTRLIAVVTNFSYYGRYSSESISPASHELGLLAIGVPVVGGLLVGLMARYGSKAIRGHGIPEAMEQILLNESKIPARMTFLKPISAAIAIGTGGPFGAEGPIIATGGALGSLLGQKIPMKSSERKTLLAAGAAAGMAATFGSPISAVLLAIELLLFEFRARSFVPVAMAAMVAAGVRAILFSSAPVFEMKTILPSSPSALGFYVLEGVVIGGFAIVLTKAIYYIEDRFEQLPIHWMWWPALGGIAVGLCGFFSPRTLGVGYDNIEKILNGDFIGTSLIVFCIFKFLSWSIALGSGTSGGTLAPIFTIGGGVGATIGTAVSRIFPTSGIDIRVAALVGMAGSFAGASRALFASIIFAFETTQQPNAILPLLGGCTAAFLISALAMENTIMTERLVRRGHHVPVEYSAEIKLRHE